MLYSSQKTRSCFSIVLQTNKKIRMVLQSLHAQMPFEERGGLTNERQKLVKLLIECEKLNGHVIKKGILTIQTDARSAQVS
jgi:hypothetical protein